MMSYVNEWIPNSPDSYITCYIYNLITAEKIEFKTVPEGVSESFQGSWASQDILGRSAPYLAYTGNPARTASYSVLLDRNILGDPGYKNTIDQCKRLVYPRYVGGGLIIPPYSYIRFGGMLKLFAVIQSVDFSWSGPFISSTMGGNNTGLESASPNVDPTVVMNVVAEAQEAPNIDAVSSEESEDPNQNLMSQCEVNFSFTEIRAVGQLIPTGASLNEFDM